MTKFIILFLLLKKIYNSKIISIKKVVKSATMLDKQSCEMYSIWTLIILLCYNLFSVMSKNHKNTTLIFFITNFLFFLIILFSYLYLKESIIPSYFSDFNPALNIFSALVFFFTTLFIVSLIYNFFINQKNKNLIFSIYFYFLLLSSSF